MNLLDRDSRRSKVGLILQTREKSQAQLHGLARSDLSLQLGSHRAWQKGQGLPAMRPRGDRVLQDIEQGGAVPDALSYQNCGAETPGFSHGEEALLLLSGSCSRPPDAVDGNSECE
jgi:hypothetical protein